MLINEAPITQRARSKRDMMLPEPDVGDYIQTYKIIVWNESGNKSLLETGISKMYKPEYLHEHINYLQECNPTKSFEIYAN
jgi:hypothetical protein